MKPIFNPYNFLFHSSSTSISHDSSANSRYIFMEYISHLETLGMKPTRLFYILRLEEGYVVLWQIIFQAAYVASYLLRVNGFGIQVAFSRQPFESYPCGSVYRIS